ncbi:DUF3916 domain-containing protein [Ectobacillus antri]|uniref:DUF3916 domain-containing protein n=1 Tax=Ectobacillus antri TaxID=2486280 RepID=A0ABT6H8Y1_9BACI|nr:DUF3916 domain-containing protein [Ectobacillus antri]MDG4658153.1 DUF3916 domain-containing protein [Ectobacillus antri]MDG5755253.1 DUF3916 domain-containing protein [Ectobacillus antri]
MKQKPSTRNDVRILLEVDFHYWHSTAIRLYSTNEETPFQLYYKDDYVRHVQLDEAIHLAHKWGLFVPNGMKIAGVREELINIDLVDEDMFGGEIWYFGELD